MRNAHKQAQVNSILVRGTQRQILKQWLKEYQEKIQGLVAIFPTALGDIG